MENNMENNDIIDLYELECPGCGEIIQIDLNYKVCLCALCCAISGRCMCSECNIDVETCEIVCERGKEKAKQINESNGGI